MNLLLSWLRQERAPMPNPAPKGGSLGEFSFDPAKLFRPAWPQRAAVEAIVRRFPATWNGMKEAWETCAAEGLIPASWIDDPGRHFDVMDILHRCPSTPRALVAIASDPEAVTFAETCAAEFESASIPWSAFPRRAVFREETSWSVCASPKDTYWTCAPTDTPYLIAREALRSAVGPDTHDAIESAAKQFASSVSVGDLKLFGRKKIEDVRWNLNYSLRGAATWRAAAQLGLALPDVERLLRYELPRASAEALQGSDFASISNLYAPIAAIWAVGFSLDKQSNLFLKLIAPTWNIQLA